MPDVEKNQKKFENILFDMNYQPRSTSIEQKQKEVRSNIQKAFDVIREGITNINIVVERDDIQSTTFLHSLIEIGSFDDIKKALTLGADPNCRNAIKTSAFHGLFSSGTIPGKREHEILKKAELLIEYGAKTDTKSDFMFDTTPLIKVIERRQQILIDFLIEICDVNYGNDDVRPIIEAVRKKDKETVKKLIEKGADIDCQDSDGYTPAMQCVRSNQKDLLDFILSFHPDLSLKAVYYLTPVFSTAKEVNILSLAEELETELEDGKVMIEMIKKEYDYQQSIASQERESEVDSVFDNEDIEPQLNGLSR